jgi:hypothetical protein
LLEGLLHKQQLWLFRNQKSRSNLVEIIKGDQGYQIVDDAETDASDANPFKSLFEWQVSDELDKRLIDGYLMTAQQKGKLVKVKKVNQLELKSQKKRSSNLNEIRELPEDSAQDEP